jgi:hypothetical protein
MRALRLSALVAVACFTLLACGRAEQKASSPSTSLPPVATPAAPAPFRVGALDVGNAIGGDKRVTAPSTEFAPSDTIFASVATEGAAPSVTLTARWSYEDGQLVDETTQTIAPTGPAVTEFHVAKPDGWPTGRYKVEIIADGRTAASREFEVR